MRILSILLILLISFFSNSQTIVEFDKMESSSTLYLSAGWFTPAATAGWYTNASVSPTQAAAIYGLGNGTSTIEQDWYSLPNKTGLDPTRQYQLKFRLASYTFTSSTATTRGVDAADYVSVQVSINGGSYVNELRITGNSNSTFPFTSTGTITHTANGSFTNSAAPTGDVYQTPAGANTTGPSTVYLNLPTGISQLAVDIFCRVNSAGEEWWIDDVELWDITPIALPVELVYFEAFSIKDANLIKWQTASECNSDYFVIESSEDGENYSFINQVTSAVNSSEIINYSVIDRSYRTNITYYRLLQYDRDGQVEVFGPVSVNNQLKVKKLIGIFNILGQSVTEFVPGNIYIEVYDDGSVLKVYK